MGFQVLNLNRIMLTVSEKNIGANKAYTKSNFKIEGLMKQAFFRDGKFHDKVIMAILREDCDILVLPPLISIKRINCVIRNIYINRRNCYLKRILSYWDGAFFVHKNI